MDARRRDFPTRLRRSLRSVLWLILLGLAFRAVQPCSRAMGTETIFVKILVDEEEATKPSIWQQRLSHRVQEASRIIAKYSPVRFVVREHGVWASDNREQDLSRSLREFEQEVRLGSSRLAIGFCSQYRFTMGRHNLGGTRGPMRSHILIRENAPSVREPERLEVLVHELGHFLGAAHSGEPTSVMRPVVGDGKARAVSFQIGFDPQNAQIVRLVGQEIRDRNILQFQALTPQTLQKLKPHYRALLQELPEDLSAARYLTFIDTLLAAKPVGPPRADDK